MKKNRRRYAILLILSSIFVYTVPGTISAVIFYMLLIMPICSLLYTCFAYGVFKVQQDIDSRHVLKGNSVQLTCAIYNDSPFLFPPMALKLIGSSLLFTQAIKEEMFILVPNSKRTFTYSLHCKYRGAFLLGIDSVMIQDPFKLFALRFRGVEPIKIMVYPHIVAMQIDFLTESQEQHNNWNRLVLQDAYSLSEIRPYQQGDTKKNIHWKISAKMQQWMMKTKKEEVKKKAIILLDTKSLDVPKERQLFLEDYCIELVVGYVKVFLDHWIPTRLLYHDLKHYDLLAAKPKDFSVFYKELAKVKYSMDSSMTSSIQKVITEKRRGDHPGMLHLFTFDLSKDLLSKLIAMNKSDIKVCVHYIMDQSQPYEEKEKKYQLVNDMQEKGLIIKHYLP